MPSPDAKWRTHVVVCSVCAVVCAAASGASAAVGDVWWSTFAAVAALLNTAGALTAWHRGGTDG